MHVRLIAFSVLVALLPLGCGDGDASGYGSSPAAGDGMNTPAETTGNEATATTAWRPKGAKLTVIESEFGSVVADGRGEALYLFDKEDGRKSECYGPCAAVWPPMLTRGRPVAAGGAKRGLLGTTRRRTESFRSPTPGTPLLLRR